MPQQCYRDLRTKFRVEHRRPGQLGYTIRCVSFTHGAAMNWADYYMRTEGGHALVQIM